jgi:hypothetical protein
VSKVVENPAMQKNGPAEVGLAERRYASFEEDAVPVGKKLKQRSVDVELGEAGQTSGSSAARSACATCLLRADCWNGR